MNEESTPNNVAPKKAFHLSKKWIIAGASSLVALIIIVVLALVFLSRPKNEPNKNLSADVSKDTQIQPSTTSTYDQTASQQLTNGKCSGEGTVNIFPPMKLDQVGFILPYGLMVGGHVTPVDHQYYNGLDIHALRDTYDVVAPADGRIVDIQHRGSKTNTPPHTVNVPSSDEYRFVFVHTCGFLTYVDLVTSIDDQIKAQMPKNFDPNNIRDIDIPVKKGEVIGHIGGQTLDFAVWDLTQKPLGFLVRLAYDNAESWKVFTAPTTKYLDPSIKDQTIAKYIRNVEPIDGKIDYDQEGKLIGTWFREGSNGYAGPSNNGHGGSAGYWFGHLSFSPDFLDPTAMVVSTGNFTDSIRIDPNDPDPGSKTASDASQFWLTAGSIDPATVNINSGLIKYELRGSGNYKKSDGTSWKNDSITKGVKADYGSIRGTLLVQMLEAHKLKVEFFPNKITDQVSSFDSNAKIYNRGDDAKIVKSSTAY